ncbi:MAG TPA: Gfo/Idh/MocA family oxidoreductase [Clostridiales bacterium]|nr:Gfo/Idh/MocA family oxidoreductase [Clostridiales bacterium]
MSDKKVYNIGIIGYGGMGSYHPELAKGVEEVKFVGSYDIKEERQKLACERGLKTYDSLDDLLADEIIDIVLIATPNDVHKEIAIKAMEAGKHVVCEKPVTVSSADLQDMIDASERTGKLLVVHQNRRWDEDFLTIKKIYDEKMLGEVFAIESRVHGSRGIPGDWRQEKEHGGGMVLDWGVHILDQALLMVNEKVKKVYATLTHVTNQLVDDGFRAELTFESGLKYILEVGTSNFITLPRWYMLGNNGTAIIENWGMDARVVCARGKSEEDIVPVRTAAGLTKTMAPRRDDTISETVVPLVHGNIKEFYKNVAAYLSGKEEIIVKLPQVMRVMKLMEAIFESAEKQQVVDFE